MNVDRWRPAIGDGAAGPSSCCGSPISPHFACYRIVIFLSPLATKSAVPAHDPRLQQEAKALETRQEVDWAATASGAADKQSATGGDGSRCFPIVIYNAGCSESHVQLQPTVERESLTGGSAAE
jgi:hypothetical protein